MAVHIDRMHEVICTRAAQIANELVMEYPTLVGRYALGGNPHIFVDASGRSKGGGLALALYPGLEHAPIEDQKLFRFIARRAVHKALIEQKESFVGVIFGEARKGRNYFERFDNASGATDASL